MLLFIAEYYSLHLIIWIFYDLCVHGQLIDILCGFVF